MVFITEEVLSEQVDRSNALALSDDAIVMYTMAELPDDWKSDERYAIAEHPSDGVIHELTLGEVKDLLSHIRKSSGLTVSGELTVEQLKDELRKRDLSTVGNKEELLERLADAVEG